jgi:hypothetical protein
VKYFTVSLPNGEERGPFSTKTAVCRCLGDLSLERFLPTLEGVTVNRWWWVRDELVECETYEAHQFYAMKASELRRGATAQWAAARGQL